MRQHEIFYSPPAKTGGFDELVHTADVALHVWGQNFELLLAWAAVGLNRLMFSGDVGPPTIVKRVTLTAFDKESLLVEWLSELVFWAESDQLLFQKADILRLTDHHFSVALHGGRLPSLKPVVKAVTFHNLSITESERGVETVVVLDV